MLFSVLAAAVAAAPASSCFPSFVVGHMCRGGNRNYPGGKRSGPKPKMDEQSVANRMKREASKERTALRKAEAAAKAVKEEEAAKEKALLREEHADQPAFRRRSFGSERIAAKAAASSSAQDAAAAAVASFDPAHDMKKLYSYFESTPREP